MPALFARLRRHRGPAVWLAAALVALQAFVAGLAMAEAAVMLAPAGAGAGFAVICHGGGAASPDTGVPGPAAAWHPCCVACAAGAGAAVLPPPWGVPIAGRPGVVASPRRPSETVLIAPRAVRAGLAQAPPSLD
jgi:hypothetical protein